MYWSLGTYEKQITERKRELDLTDEDLRNLFGNLDTIVLLHRAIYAELERSPSSPAVVFINNSKYFKLYQQYVKSFHLSLDTLNQHSDNTKLFQFLNELANSPVSDRFSCLSWPRMILKGNHRPPGSWTFLRF